MRFKVTYQPINRIAGVQPSTVEIDGAAAAWLEVNGLMQSDEKVEITDESGRPISWQQLRDLAKPAAN